jgi:hypothetical protein
MGEVQGYRSIMGIRMNAKLPRGKTPTDPEKIVQTSTAEMLRLIGFEVFRRNVGGLYDDDGNYVPFAEKGQSDLYGWVRATGVHFEFETKRYGKKPTPNQLAWLKRCTATGAHAWWADNIEDAIKVARAILAGGRIVWEEDENYWVQMP